MFESKHLKRTKRAGAPEKELEIEITPEMIEAGVKAFCRYDSRFENESEAVRAIYEAMFCLRPGAKNPFEFSLEAINQGFARKSGRKPPDILALLQKRRRQASTKTQSNKKGRNPA